MDYCNVSLSLTKKIFLGQIYTLRVYFLVYDWILVQGAFVSTIDADVVQLPTMEVIPRGQK